MAETLPSSAEIWETWLSQEYYDSKEEGIDQSENKEAGRTGLYQPSRTQE
jgi:hypothetical protein